MEELGILAEITKWMSVNSDAIYSTRPWKIFGKGRPGAAASDASFNEEKRKDLTASDVRFTTKGATLYAFVMGWPDYQAVVRPLATNTALRVGKIENVELLGFDGKLDWSQDSSGLKVVMPAQKPCDYAISAQSTRAPYRLMCRWRTSDKSREQKKNPGTVQTIRNLPPSFGINNTRLQHAGNVAVCFPRLPIQKPNGPHACLQVLANLEHQVVRLVVLGNDSITTSEEIDTGTGPSSMSLIRSRQR